MTHFMQYKNHLCLRHILALYFIAFCVVALSPIPTSAASWHPQIYDYALPQRVIAVDKKKQQFHLYEKKSPLALKLSYPCTTGQAIGDKQVVNDLRTPEGVYFIEYKIASGLDFKEYGGVAYTLNYPNPVDKLRGKTGYGIWIHSKGNDDDIVPLNTRGCIAIERKNIIEIGPKLVPGTAVVVGESLNTAQVPAVDTGTARHLRFRMEQWTRAWASRSNEFFNFYDNSSYTKAMPETFTAFKANKQRLFKILSWINIFNREVHVLEGPGYWVTWSEQFYRAPNLSTEGVRRLYWQRFDDGQFRIVGMEWIPRNVGMQAAYEKGQLIASIEKPLSDAVPVDAQEEMPTPPPLSMPEMADNTQVLPLPIPDAQLVAEIPEKETQPITTKAVLTIELNKHLQDKIKARAKALQSKNSKDFYAFYNANEFGKAKNAPSVSFKQLQNHMLHFFKAPWLDMISEKAQIQTHEDMLVTSTNQLIYLPNKKKVEGTEILYWKRDAKNNWLIVASKWQEKILGLEAAYLEKISISVANFIEDWRKDWLAADVDAYMQHYAQNTRQGQRGYASIAAQKKGLWAIAAPKEIQLSGLRVQLDERGVRADMMQIYESVDGKGDKGTKTLLLVPYNNGWKIVREEWAALPSND